MLSERICFVSVISFSVIVSEFILDVLFLLICEEIEWCFIDILQPGMLKDLRNGESFDRVSFK